MIPQDPEDFILFNTSHRASLVAQWLRVRLLMQGARVRAPVREDPTCREAAGPVSHGRCTLDKTEGRASELEGGTVELIPLERQKEKSTKE